MSYDQVHLMHVVENLSLYAMSTITWAFFVVWVICTWEGD